MDDRRVWRSLYRELAKLFPLGLGVLACVTALLCSWASPNLAQTHLLPAAQSHQSVQSPPADPALSVTSGQSFDQTGRAFYQQERFTDAIAAFQQALHAYQQTGDRLRQAMTLSNLALTYQQLGAWHDANAALDQSQTLLHSPALSNDPDYDSVLAQTLDIQGRLQLEQGQTEAALTTWQTAAATYERLGNILAVIRSQINQAQAMQALGLYRRAIATLTDVSDRLQTQPDSALKATGLRSLGDALRVAGNLTQSHEVLQTSLDIAQRLQQPEVMSDALFSLANTVRAQGDPQRALDLYQQASTHTTSLLSRVQIQLNQLSLLLRNEQFSDIPTFLPQLQTDLQSLPPSRTAIYAQVNFASSLMDLGVRGEALGISTTAPTEIAQWLTRAIRQAQQLGDRRAESYALGSLGTLYEQTAAWENATKITERSLLLAQSVNADDISYRWQWQLGRILKARSDQASDRDDLYESAIAAYSEAINSLKSLRNDLVAINPEVQFSFQASVEPVYREFVSLLLSRPGQTEAEHIEKARQAIESLQLAELEDFFRSACLDAQAVNIDQIDQQAAVIYPIILPDRLEIILSAPQQPLRHYSTPISADEIEAAVLRFRPLLTDRRRTDAQILPLAQQFYDWLIRPLDADLANSEVETLVFVLDGSLRSVPMSVLHNGQTYLVERYGIALTPGLQLLSPRSLQRQRLTILAAGLTEGRQGFSALPSVGSELTQIQDEVPTRVLLNQQFTSSALQDAVDRQPYPVVHLATHGKFSSNLDDTFILAWDDRIDINQLNTILQNTDLNRRQPIELLVLSACQTASGDRRAALGIAGMAVRAGARSTVASLWSVDDAATSALMTRFYTELTHPTVTKAEALRRAQRSLLDDPQYRQRPYFWAPFVLVGNWL